jgi:hypothetical protein
MSCSCPAHGETISLPHAQRGIFVVRRQDAKVETAASFCSAAPFEYELLEASAVFLAASILFSAAWRASPSVL